MPERVLHVWESAAIGSSRIVWRLLSPSSRLIVCTVSKTSAGFTLRVSCGDEALAFCDAPALDTLHARAAGWRRQLESQGYVAATSAPTPGPRSKAPASEARAAAIGLVECARELAARQPEAARRLRDRATEALVALWLSDMGLLAEVAGHIRAALAGAAVQEDADAQLIKSAAALVDRLDSVARTTGVS